MSQTSQLNQLANSESNSRTRNHLDAQPLVSGPLAETHALLEGQTFEEYLCFRLAILQTDSLSLVGNPLGDPQRRRHGVLVPKKEPPHGGWPVVFVLAGFTGNGPNYFNLKSFEVNFPHQLDRLVAVHSAPRAVYVFVEAMTYWGGSQFLNSAATGRYEDFVLDDLVPAVRARLPVSREPSKWCVMGGSSGGYGALHLSSIAPRIFGLAAAIAPDSFFEASLLPEFWTAAPTLIKLGGLNGLRDELESGRLQRRKDWHSLINAVAMALCYAGETPEGDADRSLTTLFPIDLNSGKVDFARFGKIKEYDPIVFLGARALAVQELNGIFIDVGTRDQFHLQYGARQIRDVLLEQSAPLSYSEFEGNHFDISERRPLVWRWLLTQPGWS